MKKISLLISVAIALTSYAQQPTKVWSLEDCMEYAVKNNLQVKQQQLSLQDADITVTNAYGSYLPNISGRATNTWNTGLSVNPITNIIGRTTVRNSNYSLNANMPVFSGFQNYYRLQQANLQKIANQYNIDTTKDNIRLQIANSYLQIVLQQENLEVLKAQHVITLEQIDRTQKLIEAGNLPKGDILELEATSATDLRNIANAENNVLISKAGLKQVLNLKLDAPFKIEEVSTSFDDLEVIEKPVKTILSEVLTTRNEVQLAKQNILLADQQIKISKTNLYPSVSAFANFNTSELGRSRENVFTQLNDNRGFNYGLSLNVPILNGLQNRNSVKRSQVSKLRSENQLAQTQQRITQDVYQAYLDAKASSKAFEASKKSVLASEQAYEYAKNRFEVGISNSLDFTQAQIRLQNRKLQLNQAKYDLLFKLKLLELYINGKID